MSLPARRLTQEAVLPCLRAMQQIAFRNGAIPIEKSVANADWLERREGLARDDCMIRLGPSIRELMLERLVPIASSDGL